ncbi:outer membrane beta-barrel protein [Prevotella sp. P6B4]|uniref:outer membrane beta-barrel protein n=1 Tax=Prevotella sp. P6B4 TaxID=1410614 RepID=UPI000A973097|nr:outer membrane beta-barrel protein [Prevotella sp. P6B4]
MKKVFAILLLAVVCSGNVMAQKGRNGIGANVAWNLFKDSAFGLGVKYQTNVTDNIRIEPSFNFYPVTTMPSNEYDSTKGCYSWIGNLNMHYFIGKPSRWRPYIIAGLALGNLKSREYVDNPSLVIHTDYGSFYDQVMSDKNKIDFGVNAGIGWDLRISYAISLQLEPKIILQKNITLAPTIGLTYYFK